jgi:hypothetical protein
MKIKTGIKDTLYLTRVPKLGVDRANIPERIKI